MLLKIKKVLKEEIIRLRKERYTYKEIRKKLSCTLSVISYHCRNANLGTKNPRNYPSEEIILLANKLYKEGNNLKQISEITGKTRHSIKKYIHNYDVKKYNKNITTAESVVNWRRRTKQQLVEYKGGKCFICGYNKCNQALDFHHINPLEKEFTIGGKSWSFEKLKLEADKCLLVCRNCHTEIHTGLHKDKGL